MSEETTGNPAPSAAGDNASLSGAGRNSPEIGAAEKAAAAIMTGVKNFGVFPPEHASTIGMLQGVLRTFGQYWEKYGSLTFEVEKQSLVYSGKAIYEGPAADDNPAFVLHRAGISRFEFAPGLEEQELISFFLIYNHYRVEADEPDDDLVSALWRAGLPHIFYEASYELWSETENAVDYDALAAVDPAGHAGPEVTARPGKGWEALRLDSGGDNYRKVSLALFPGVGEYCTLTEVEREALTRMVGEDTPASGSEVAVRLMFLLLERESEAPVHQAALGFLQEVYLDFLAKRGFQRAYFVLDNVRRAAAAAKEAKPWALPAFQKFYDAVLQPEIIAGMVAVWPHFAELGALEVKALAAILQQFPAQVGAQLAAGLGGVESPEAQKLFVELIIHHARHDRGLLTAGLHSQVEPLVVGMLAIIKELNDRQLVEQLLPKLRYDSRSRVRQEAMHILASHNIY